MSLSLSRSNKLLLTVFILLLLPLTVLLALSPQNPRKKAIGPSPTPTPQPKNPFRHRSGEIIVGFKQPPSPSDLSSINHLSGYSDFQAAKLSKTIYLFKSPTLKQESLNKIEKIEAESKRAKRNISVQSLTDVDPQLVKAINKLATQKTSLQSNSADSNRILFAEPNYLVETSDFLPNDPRFNELWGLSKINAPQAWDIQTGQDVVVGIIDTGIDYNHEDLTDNIWINSAEDINGDGRFTPADNNGIDDDGNGFIDDVVGWDFTTCAQHNFWGTCVELKSPDNDPMDDNRHGTHVSGTIAAVGNNDIGVAGASWSTKLMAIKFISRDGSGSTSDAILAIKYSIQMGAKITNNSWGGYKFSQSLKTAIKDAGEAGQLFIAAAGNGKSPCPFCPPIGVDTDLIPQYPSSYDLDNIISVAATDNNDELAKWSNYGRTSVDLAAPGVDILSSIPKEKYDLLSGTSMATPHVVGVASLLWSENPDLTYLQVKNFILKSADKLPQLDEKTVSGGRLNPLAAFVTLYKGRNDFFVAKPDVLDFGIVIPQKTLTRSIRIINTGISELTISLALPNNNSFQLKDQFLQIPINQSKKADIIFQPSTEGSYQAKLLVGSNTRIPLRGEAKHIPKADTPIRKFSINLGLKEESNKSETFILKNSGTAPLQWQFITTPPPWLSFPSKSGIVSPNTTENINFELSSKGLAEDDYYTYQLLSTNDPYHPKIQLRIDLHVDRFLKITEGSLVNDISHSRASSWGDYDNDGDLDLYVANSVGMGNALYRNNGDGTFTNVTGNARLGSRGNSVDSAWVDYDNDGNLDLFVVNENDESNYFYRNNGNGTFKTLSRQDVGPVVADRNDSQSSAWGDYDNDGDLDLFVANSRDQNNALYRNLLAETGRPNFEKITQGIIAEDTGRSMSASWIDLDNDRDLDLFVTNQGDPGNFVYRNDSGGTFTKLSKNDVGPIAGNTGGSKTASWGDWDNDGDFDLFIASANSFPLFYQNLFAETGNLKFRNIPTYILFPGQRVYKLGFASSSSWGDYDNDGDLDLYATDSGSINRLYRNNGDGTFTEIRLGSIILEGGIYSYSASWADYDNDGDLDIFIAGSGKNLLFRNTGDNNNWVNIKLNGTNSNTSAIGAKIRVKATINGTTVTQTQEISAKTGRGSQNSFNAEFGLGDAPIVNQVEIEWSNGIGQVINDVAVNQFLTVTGELPPACIASCRRCDANGDGEFDPIDDSPLIWRKIDTNCDENKDIADVEWCTANCLTQPTPTPNCTDPADANCNGEIDHEDLFPWRTRWSDPQNPDRNKADLDNNNSINILDYLLLLTSWLR